MRTPKALLSLALIAGGLTLAACGGSDSSETAEKPARPTNGGTISYGHQQEPPCLSGGWVELGISCLFISHDLGVIHHMSDRVLVLNEGKVVETGTADEIFFAPTQPYTRALVAALPKLETRQVVRHEEEVPA
ncbi:MAG: hypothetical protein ACSLFR_01785 [Solirubrobacteraceae bacterium]